MNGRDTPVAGLMHPAEYADPWGQVAETASITPQQLCAAYAHGVFPWTDNPVGWFCPSERAVLAPHLVHFPRNLPRLMRKAGFTFRADSAFGEVVRSCAQTHAHEGVWLTPRFRAAYEVLHRRGLAHSIEVLQDGRLVGGVYGVQVGRIYCAESMFAHVSHASKAALHALFAHRRALGIELVDVQVMGETTKALGAINLPRPMYLDLLGVLAPEGSLVPKTWRLELPAPTL
jgi:leucyl/phenylalanyl-tRNA--protein transferase